MPSEGGRLELKGKKVVPIVSGGMGVNISTADLALAVAALGGVGHISDAMSPYVADKLYDTRFQAEKGRRFHHLVDESDKKDVKWDPQDVYSAQRLFVERTMEKKRGDGGVFINIMEKLTMGQPKPTLKARLEGAMDGGIDGITLSAGLHLGSFDLVKDHPRFRDVAFGIIVSSPRALKLFLQGAKKTGRLPDYVVIEGPLAGGHLGFGQDWKEHQLSTIFADVVRFLEESGISIPLIPAGGIFTSEDAAEYLRNGAAAVQVATRFVITNECGLPEAVKQKYLAAEENDVVVNQVSPTGYPMRMLKSSPCLTSNVRPSCESLGYMLDSQGRCAYRDAYQETPSGDDGRKLPVKDKMCICYHFMKNQCYTCGQNVFRLKETVGRAPDGSFLLPSAAEVFQDYARAL